MRRYAYPLAALLALAPSAQCLARPLFLGAPAVTGVSAEMTLTGRLVLKGSAPFSHLALICDDGTQWQLYGAPDRAEADLQNQIVTITGEPVQASPGSMLRGFTVLTLTPK